MDNTGGKMDVKDVKYLLLDRESGNAYCVNKKNKKTKLEEPRIHSDSFNWGFGGSGPADLALAICKLMGKEEHYQDFKWMTISKLDITSDHKLDLDLDFLERNKKIIESIRRNNGI